MWLVLPF
jgi:thymidylate synthase